MDKKLVISVVIALALAAFAAFVGLLTIPLAEPLVWAMVIGIATHPHLERVARRFPQKGRAAGIMVLLVTICIILPSSLLILALAQNATEVYHQSEQFIQSVRSTGVSALMKVPIAAKLMQFADRMGLDISGHASQIASSASKFLVTAASGAVKNVAHFVLTLGMAIFILFFIYRDGEEIVEAGVKRFAGDERVARHYVTQMRETTTAVVVGTILTCLAHGALAGVGYWWAGVPAPILFGCLTAIAALIPVVGTAVIWVPLAGYLALTGAYLQAGLLAGWCGVFVGLSDHFIRPLAVGSKSNIPVLAIVFGAVGGAEVLGLLGLIVGPIIFALLVVVWRDVTSSEPMEEPPQDPPAWKAE